MCSHKNKHWVSLHTLETWTWNPQWFEPLTRLELLIWFIFRVGRQGWCLFFSSSTNTCSSSSVSRQSAGRHWADWSTHKYSSVVVPSAVGIAYSYTCVSVGFERQRQLWLKQSSRCVPPAAKPPPSTAPSVIRNCTALKGHNSAFNAATNQQCSWCHNLWGSK